jgi:hypothetical protein
MGDNPETLTHSADLPTTLLHLLSNSLVLDQTVPYLPISSLLALGATSKSFKDLVHRTPNVFRHVDLSNVKSAQFEIANIDNGGNSWRNVQLDENVTEEECVHPCYCTAHVNRSTVFMADLFCIFSTPCEDGTFSKMFKLLSSMGYRSPRS